MDPLNYQIDVANPVTSALQGYQAGIGINQIQQQQAQQQAELAQARAKQERVQQMHADLSGLSQNGTPEAIGAMILKYPEMSEQLKRGADVVAPAQQQARLKQAVPVYAAIQSGANDLAVKLLTEQAAANRNSGNEQDAKAAETMAQLVKDHPEFAKTTIGLKLASEMGPDKFTQAFKDLQGEQRSNELQPGAVKKGNADARTAEADATTKEAGAKYAPQSALLDLQKKGWDIKNIESEIGSRKEQNRIAAMNAAYNKEGNELKRQELGIKIKEAQQSFDDKVRGKVADAESAASNIDNMLDTIKRVKSHPALNDVLGSVEGSDYYPNALVAAGTTLSPYGAFSSSGDERNDVKALITTLGSQAFLSQIPSMKGQGSLSNAEGEQLRAALTNLSRKQSEKQFNENLDVATRILGKSRNNVSKRYGVPLGNPDTPSATASDKRPPLSSFGG